MTIDAWLEAAQADAERRGLSELKPLLEALGRATTALRAADFNDTARPSAAETGAPAATSGSSPSRPSSPPAKS